MKKHYFQRFTALLLCVCTLGLASCKPSGSDGADTGDSASGTADGLAGIGYTTGSYNGIFDGVMNVSITLGEAELSTVTEHADAELYCQGNVTVNGTTVEGVGIKARGNTSYVTDAGSDRYSFKIKFNKYTKGQKLNGLDELYLNNVSYDPSYVREYLAYALFASHQGIKAPLAAFARLYINSEYYGLYLAVEAVDDSFLKRAYGDNDGDLYKAGSGSAFITDDTSTFSLENGEDEGFAKLTALYEALLSGNGIEDILDVESVLRYAAVISLICAQESYLGTKAENYFLYSQDGKLSMIPWDLKMSFGTDRSLRKTEYSIDQTLAELPVLSPYIGVSAADRPLVSKLLEKEEYTEQYKKYVKEYVSVLESALAKLADLKSEIDQYVGEDKKKFYSDSLYQAEYTDADNTLYGFIKRRCENVSAQLNTSEEE